MARVFFNIYFCLWLIVVLAVVCIFFVVLCDHMDSNSMVNIVIVDIAYYSRKSLIISLYEFMKEITKETGREFLFVLLNNFVIDSIGDIPYRIHIRQ